MQNDQVFREKIVEPEETAAQMEARLVELKSDDVTGAQKASEETDEPQPVRESALERWETEHGKYGVELFGIKEVVGEFPYKMQFGGLDNYIKSELAERGLEPTQKAYQDILAELEEETGTKGVEVLTKMKKLFEYIQILKKFRDLKKKKETFKASFV